MPSRSSQSQLLQRLAVGFDGLVCGLGGEGVHCGGGDYR